MRVGGGSGALKHSQAQHGGLCPAGCDEPHPAKEAKRGGCWFESVHKRFEEGPQYLYDTLGVVISSRAFMRFMYFAYIGHILGILLEHCFI